MIDRNLNYGRHILERWIKPLNINAALDIGAGHGNDLQIVANNSPTAALAAVESNMHYANSLRSNGISVVECNLERSKLPYPDASFDLVIANQIFEHLKEIHWVLDQITRTLRVGGYFYLGVPNLASLHNRLLLLAGMQPTCIDNSSAHVRGFTKPDLIRMLQGWPKGYEMVSFAGSNFYPFPPPIARPLARAAPTFSATIFMLLRKNKSYNGEFLKTPEDMETNFFLGEKIHHVV